VSCNTPSNTPDFEPCLQERGKFQQETLVNVGGRQRRSSLSEKK